MVPIVWRRASLPAGSRTDCDDVDSDVDRPCGLGVGDLDDHRDGALGVVPFDAGDPVPGSQFHHHRILAQQEANRCAQLACAWRNAEGDGHLTRPAGRSLIVPAARKVG